MRKALTLSLVLLGLTAPAAAQSPELQAAKKVHVNRFWDECTAKHNGATTICADLIRALEARERKTLKRISAAATDSNKPRVSEGVVGCYNPTHNYKDLVQCWELLANELEQNGE